MVEYKTQGHEKVLEWKSQRLFGCQGCEYKDHADFNASKNLSGSGRTTETQRKAVA